jgi:hypothetical protein
LFEKKARISQAEAEEIAMKAETSAKQKGEWFPLPTTRNHNEANQRQRPDAGNTRPLISKPLQTARKVHNNDKLKSV